MITHITKSDMRATGLDLNRTLHRIVQSTLDREYKKDPTNYVAHAHDKLLKRYGKKTTNVEQPDKSVKQVVELQLKKYFRDDKRGGEITGFYGNYTMIFHLHTHEQIQGGEPSIEFLKGYY